MTSFKIICLLFVILHLCGVVNLAAAVASTSNASQLPRSMKAFLLQPARQRDQPVKHKPVPGATNDVLSVAKSNSAGKFAELVLKTSWLSSTLVNSSGAVTVFAFSDEAYNMSSNAVKTALANVEHPGSRDAVLQYHVARGAHYRKDIAIPHVDTTLYSLFPSPPLSSSTSFQPIHVDSYSVFVGEILKTIVTASGATVVKADLKASNGVVHIIDKVIYPVPTGVDMAKYLEEEPKYSMLYASLQNASLTSALSTPPFQPLTILAPSDAAFGKLSPAQRSLLQNTTILKQVLTYHVVKGSFYSAAIYNNFQIRSMEGSTIYFEKGAGGVYAEEKKLVEFDTTVTNGVVHELNGVMFPRMLERVLGNHV